VKFKIQSGTIKEEIHISDSNLISTVAPKEISSKNEDLLLMEALKEPVDSPDLVDFLYKCRKLLIIVNDGARATPTAKILKILSKFWKDIDLKFIVATGAHNNPTEEELKLIFGDFYFSHRKCIQIHDAVNDPMIDLGETSRGTPVKFNGIIAEVDKIININSIEPHYFAGYTGGRKSFLPGIASYKTIEKNHSLVMDPEAQIVRLEGNPVHEDMMEAVKKLEKEIFSIMTVLDMENNICSVSAGNWQTSFHEAVERTEEIFIQQIPEKADIIISVVKAPLNKDLYQTQKGIENCKAALKKDAILILIAECSGGIGKDEFYKLLSSCKEPQEVFSKIKEGYKLGYHKAAKFVEFFSNYKLWMITEIPEEKLEKIFIKKYASIETALKEALTMKGKDAGIIVNLDAGTTIPVI